MKMKIKILLLVLASVACLSLTSCNKNKDKKNDPLRSTTWTAYDQDDLMVLKFELGTLSTFYIGDNNLQRKGEVGSSAYTLKDSKIVFNNLNGAYDTKQFHFKSGTLDGDAMTVRYDRWTTVAGMDSPKESIQAVFKKHTGK